MAATKSSPHTTHRSARRKISEIVSEESLQRFRDEINHHLAILLKASSPDDASDADEQRPREEILRDGIRKAMLGALLYLNERDHAAFEALLAACGRYVRDSFAGESPRFEVRRRRKDEQVLYRAAGVVVLSNHQHLTAALKRAFNAADKPTVLGGSRFDDRPGRYTVRQWEGTKRFHETTRRRAIAILEVAERILRPGLRDALKLPADGTVREWARKRRPPADVSLRLLAIALGKSPATVRNLLVLARRQAREASQLLERLGPL